MLDVLTNAKYVFFNVVSTHSIKICILSKSRQIYDNVLHAHHARRLGLRELYILLKALYLALLFIQFR